MKPPAAKTYLQRWTVTIPPEDGRQPRLVGALRRLEATLGQVEGRMPSARDAKESLREVERAWRRGPGIKSTPKRHLRRVAWALFQPWARDGLDLPAYRPFVLAYREWLTANQSGGQIARLIPPYLRHFPEDAVFREDWRQFLAEALLQHPGRRLSTWRERHRGFGLLEADGPHQLARRLMRNAAQYEELLEEAGFTGFLADSRFVRVAHTSVIQQVSEELRRNPNLSLRECEALLSALESSPGVMRFQDLRPSVAEALLAPWVDRTPPEPVKKAIRGFLQRHLGNPNIRKGRWSGVAGHLRQVFLRWLAEEALETFFSILSETAKAHHWEARKRFWEAYLQEDMISDAWLALGTSAASLARAAHELPAGAWARLQGAQSTQSVLLFRINNITVLEWSHDGAGRIWIDGNTNAPLLYRPAYVGSSLRKESDFWFSHISGWQSKAARWIRSETGLRPDLRGRIR